MIIHVNDFLLHVYDLLLHVYDLLLHVYDSVGHLDESLVSRVLCVSHSGRDENFPAHLSGTLNQPRAVPAGRFVLGRGGF